MAFRYSRFLALLIMCAAVVGCGGRGSKMTQANYDRITDGMTLTQVEEVLGKGDVLKDAPALEGVARVREKYKDAKVLTWEWKPKSILIVFADDKVVFKSKGGF